MMSITDEMFNGFKSRQWDRDWRWTLDCSRSWRATFERAFVRAARKFLVKPERQSRNGWAHSGILRNLIRSLHLFWMAG
jgi:hypothetical protein